jgi:hypothetical protein
VSRTRRILTSTRYEVRPSPTRSGAIVVEVTAGEINTTKTVFKGCDTGSCHAAAEALAGYWSSWTTGLFGAAPTRSVPRAFRWPTSYEVTSSEDRARAS